MLSGLQGYKYHKMKKAFLDELDERTPRDTEAFKKLGNVLNEFLADDSKTAYPLTTFSRITACSCLLFGCAVYRAHLCPHVRVV